MTLRAVLNAGAPGWASLTHLPPLLLPLPLPPTLPLPLCWPGLACLPILQTCPQSGRCHDPEPVLPQWLERGMASERERMGGKRARERKKRFSGEVYVWRRLGLCIAQSHEKPLRYATYSISRHFKHGDLHYSTHFSCYVCSWECHTTTGNPLPIWEFHLFHASANHGWLDYQQLYFKVGSYRFSDRRVNSY